MSAVRDGSRRRSPARRILGTVAVTVVALVLGLQLLGRLSPQHSDGPVAGTAAGGTPGATAAPTRSPTPSVPPASPTAGAPSATPRSGPEPPNRSLTRNSAYAVDLGGRRVRCAIRVRSPKPPLATADLAPYLRTVVHCLVRVYRRPLAARGFSIAEPTIRVYRSTVRTPCGRFDQTGAPAYYCATDQTIYWPATRDDGREAYTFARLGYVALVAHEFGHHLQAETGMITDYGRFYATADGAGQRNLLSRRLELQAQCFEGVFLATVAGSIDLSSGDRAELRRWHSFTGDDDPPASRDPDHGSSAAQVRWLERGLDQDVGRCNTWSAPRSAVK